MSIGSTTIGPFLAQYGFTADPFELTNSDSEPLLSTYFVPPPFFSSVLGDPTNPRPVAVFAPRGTGKSAQRLSVEEQSRANKDFLCVTYDDFGITSKAHLQSVNLDHHLTQLSIRMTLAILAHLEMHEGSISSLSKHQRHVALYCSRTLLGNLTQQQYAEALGSVKTLLDKGGEVWAKYGGVVATILAGLLKKVGLDDLTIPTELKESFQRADSLRYIFSQLLEIAQTLGYKSTYILVDKVDELSQTSQDSQASWRLVQDMLTDLPLLETSGAGFKFFLWDQVRSFFLEQGRSDRVQMHDLRWTPEDLRLILRRRLQAYSDGRISDISALLADDCADLDLETLVVYLAAGSPRDMVRMCKAIIDEATRVGGNAGGVTRRQLFSGITSFSRSFAEVACAGRLPELRKIGNVTFTINQLASDVFNVSENAARSRVQKWQDSGIVRKVDERPNRVNRPLHVYSITDPRVAIACSETMELDLVLDNYMVLCAACGELQVVGDSQFRCTACDQVQTLESVQSLWQSAIQART
ncbi:MAG: hypothetical protein JWM93_2115 [Frankiales bacterium]|nr:hypothetical protein [Frankiales bacterium]